MTYRSDLISSAAISEKGARERNEDAFLACEHPRAPATLFVVSDGLGGQRDGALASQAVIDAAQAAFFTIGSFDDVHAALALVLHSAHSSLNELAARYGVPRAEIPDATVVMLLICGDVAVHAHLGDSRLFRAREQGAEQLTQDHSIAAMIGSLLPPRQDPDRARLARTVSSVPRAVDISGPFAVESGEGFLLCTDGLWQAVNDADIHADYLSSSSPYEWVASLRDRVLASGDAEQDNFTALGVFLDARAEDRR